MFFSKKYSSFSQGSFGVLSSSRWSKISWEMSAYEVEGIIKPIQKKFLLNILLGLNFSAHSHPIHANIARGHLHIFPPITTVEGCKYSGFKS